MPGPLLRDVPLMCTEVWAQSDVPQGTSARRIPIPPNSTKTTGEKMGGGWTANSTADRLCQERDVMVNPSASPTLLRTRSLGGLQVLIQQVCGGARGSPFLTSSQVALMLLTWGPYLEKSTTYLIFRLVWSSRFVGLAGRRYILDSSRHAPTKEMSVWSSQYNEPIRCQVLCLYVNSTYSHR